MVRLESERLVTRTLEEEDAPRLQRFLSENRDFHAPWDPARDDDFFTLESAAESIERFRQSGRERTGLSVCLFPRDGDRIIGYIGISNIVYGPFLSCFLGYKLDRSAVGNGYLAEALPGVISICFRDYGLHRIEANVMPRNLRSIKVLKRLGFECEGLSRDYLKINGVWEDHFHYVLLNAAL